MVSHLGKSGLFPGKTVTMGAAGDENGFDNTLMSVLMVAKESAG